MKTAQEILTELHEWIESDEVYDLLPGDGADDRFIDIFHDKLKSYERKPTKQNT